MAKRLFFGGLAVLLIVAGVVVYNAATLESKQIDFAPAPKVDFDIEAAVARLVEAVTFETVSYQDPADFDAGAFEGLHAFLAESFPRVSPSSGPVYETIERTIREVAPGTIVTPYLVIGGTDSRRFEPICNHIYRFLPMQIHSDDLKRMHGTNERLAVDAYATILQFYHRLIENAAM